jgi:hypothetical protein
MSLAGGLNKQKEKEVSYAVIFACLRMENLIYKFIE